MLLCLRHCCNCNKSPIPDRRRNIVCDAAIFDAISSLGNNSPFSVITKSKFDFTFCGGIGEVIVCVCVCAFGCVCWLVGWMVGSFYSFLDLLNECHTEWVRYYEYEIYFILATRISTKNLSARKFQPSEENTSIKWVRERNKMLVHGIDWSVDSFLLDLIWTLHAKFVMDTIRSDTMGYLCFLFHFRFWFWLLFSWFFV